MIQFLRFIDIVRDRDCRSCENVVMRALAIVHSLAITGKVMMLGALSWFSLRFSALGIVPSGPEDTSRLATAGRRGRTG